MASRTHGRVLRLPQIIALLVTFFLASAMGGVLLAGLAVPFAAAAGTATNSATGLFDDMPADLNPSRPSEVSTIYYEDGSVMTHFWYQNRINVPLAEISPNIQQAIVAVEDHRFYEHNGVDVEGMARALVNNAQGGSTEGASTLTQQYVKNVFVERASQIEITDPVAARDLYEKATAQSYGRKLQEARYAIQLEKLHSKDQILEGYLNIAQFGVSVYGVEAASQHYFGHSAAELTLAEASLLAGIPQSPSNLDPIRNPENAKARQGIVLRAMLRDGLITQAEFDEAAGIPIEDLVQNTQTMSSGCASAGVSAYFCSYVVRDLLTNDAYTDFLGETTGERQTTLLAGGLQIYTTVDPNAQQIAFDSITAQIPVNDPSGINMALSSVEPGTGRIKAMVQNTNFGNNPTEEDPEQTEVNYNVGTAYGGGQGFQTGSTFKVFTLTDWVMRNQPLTTQVPAQISEYPANTWNISCAPEYRGNYLANNIEGSYRGANISVLEATKRSINLPFVWMANQSDMCNIIGTAEAMGVERGNGEPLELYPSSVLGANTNTPLSMASAFATLANEGVACETVAITGISSPSGESFEVGEPECEKVLSPEVARGVTYALEGVVEQGGTGFRADIPGRDVAGKTGTANLDWHAWFVGYTPQLSTAVWNGHTEANISMFNSTVKGRFHGEVYGGLFAAPAWRNFTEAVLASQPTLEFTAPKPLTIEGHRIPVPYVVGRSPAEATTILENAGFKVSVAPDPVFSDAPVGAVATQSPSGRAPVGATIVLTLSKGPDPALQAPPATETPTQGPPPEGNNGVGPDAIPNPGNNGSNG